MSHHFLNLLEALQECNSTPLPKVSMCRIRDSDHTSSFFVKKRDTAVFVHFVCGWMWCWRFSVCLKKEYFLDLLSFPLNKIEFRILSMVTTKKKKNTRYLSCFEPHLSFTVMKQLRTVYISFNQLYPMWYPILTYCFSQKVSERVDFAIKRIVN